MLAAGRGHAAIVRLLLDHGARVNIGDKVNETFGLNSQLSLPFFTSELNCLFVCLLITKCINNIVIN